MRNPIAAVYRVAVANVAMMSCSAHRQGLALPWTPSAPRAILITDRSVVQKGIMSARVTALEARIRFGTLLRRVVTGEEIVVIRYDKPVARVTPAASRHLRDVRQAVDSLRSLRSAIAESRRSGQRLDDGEIKSISEDGRQ
ncbi:MAG: type II toxin-antitoxin system prevent-host-death family antitoxin [Acidobacteriia bacterium]|nr:type II toxin-antitoxin system prevent-host-death family antitoxin [Terriglobia bacterium]